jgi:hypothetical protein
MLKGVRRDQDVRRYFVPPGQPASMPTACRKTLLAFSRLLGSITEMADPDARFPIKR